MASASTKPSVAESNVTDTGLTPEGTGPPTGPGGEVDGGDTALGTGEDPIVVEG